MIFNLNNYLGVQNAWDEFFPKFPNNYLKWYIITINKRDLY